VTWDFPAAKTAEKVRAGLSECNDSPLLGLWLRHLHGVCLWNWRCTGPYGL